MKLLSNKNIKKIAVPVIIIILALVAAVIILPTLRHVAISPSDLAKSAVSDLKQTPALSFKTTSQLTVNAQTREYGNINGEFTQNGNFHIKGEILGSTVDLYQIGDNTYRLDNPTNTWLKTTENAQMYDTALFNETNPLEQFEIADFGTPTEIKTSEKNTYAIRFSPILTNNSLSKYFKNIIYTIYCDKNKNLTKAVITGTLINNTVEGRLTITTEFKKLPTDYQITAPISE